MHKTWIVSVGKIHGKHLWRVGVCNSRWFAADEWLVCDSNCCDQHLPCAEVDAKFEAGAWNRSRNQNYFNGGVETWHL